MAAPLDAPWNNNTITDTVLGEVTVGKGTSFPGTWEVNRMFLRSDQGKLYHNTGTEGTPVFTLVAAPPGIFGNGLAGNATDPVFPAVGVIQYDNLTFDNNTTWTATGYEHLIVYVADTLTIAASVTWTINGTGMNAGNGGKGGGGSGSDGGNGATPFTFVVIAKTVIAGSSASITMDSTANGGNGTNGVNPGSRITTGGRGFFGSASVVGSHIMTEGISVGIGGNNSGGSGGVATTHGNAERLIHSIRDVLTTVAGSGHGGGEGGAGVTAAPAAAGGGGGGAAGGSAFHADGGAGGGGGAGIGGNSGGPGGGGSGGGALFIVITDSMDADCAMVVSAGNGGNGGNGGSGAGSGNGGGGGGGAACNLLVAPSDPSNTRTETGGSGGNAGTGGPGGIAGSTGGTADIFIDIDDLVRIDS